MTATNTPAQATTDSARPRRTGRLTRSGRPGTPRRTGSRRVRVRGRLASAVVANLGVLAVAAMFLVPLLWVVLASFNQQGRSDRVDPRPVDASTTSAPC